MLGFGSPGSPSAAVPAGCLSGGCPAHFLTPVSNHRCRTFVNIILRSVTDVTPARIPPKPVQPHHYHPPVPPLLVHPTPQQIERAQALYPFDALKDSIMSGQSNLYGALGEIIFNDLYPEWQKVESYNHDFSRADGATVDIKTKRTTTVPQGNWNCSVAATSEHQQPDYLFFLRVAESMKDAWVLGWLARDEFYDRARFGKKDDPDPDGQPGWVYRADCWNVRVDELRPVSLPGTTRCAECEGMLGDAPGFVDYTSWCGCPFYDPDPFA